MTGTEKAAKQLNEYKDMFEKTSILCEVHGKKMVRVNHLAPFCPECAREKVEADDLALREELTKKAENRNQRWLRSRSLVTGGKEKIDEMLKMNFDNFDVMDAETKLNKKKARDLANDYYLGGSNNAILSGKFGTGKTHLAMAVLNGINEAGTKERKDIKALFIETYELMQKIYSSFEYKDSPYSESRMTDMLIQADLLVIDDLGAEVGSFGKMTEAGDFVTRVLTAILRGRENKPTIFTTNLNSEELEQVYDGRLTSRLFAGISQEDALVFKDTTDKRKKLKF